MNLQQRKRLAACGLAEIHFDADMAAYCTLRVGGRAAALLDVTNLEELSRLLALLADEQITFLVIGRGSNLLVADSGWSGAVIRLKGAFNAIELLQPSCLSKVEGSSETAVVKVGAGCPLGKFVAWCGRQGLAGLEFLVGIPGSVGGALQMNAGAQGQEIGSYLLALECVDKQGDIRHIAAENLRLGYRRLSLPEDDMRAIIIIAALFRLSFDHQENIRSRCASYLEQRKSKQPAGVASAGSFFKNPPGDFAGRLIEAAGLKGLRCGAAMISPVHANFLINSGGASATDMITLMEQVRTRVAARFGIQLEPEVQLIADAPETACP